MPITRLPLSRLAGRKAAVAAVGAVAALGVGGTAYAATGTGSATPSLAAGTSGTGTTTPGGHAKRADRGLLGRADHATVEVRSKGQWVTFTIDRGKVTSVSPTAITLARPDGQSVTEAINSSTRYRGVGSEQQIQTQKAAVVVSQNGTAVRIGQKAPAAATAPTP